MGDLCPARQGQARSGHTYSLEGGTVCCWCGDRSPERKREERDRAYLRRAKPPTRSEAERIRAREQVVRLRAVVDSLAIAIDDTRCPVGFEAPQSVLLAAGVLSATLSRLDAYQRAEDDGRKSEPGHE